MWPLLVVRRTTVGTVFPSADLMFAAVRADELLSFRENCGDRGLGFGRQISFFGADDGTTHHRAETTDDHAEQAHDMASVTKDKCVDDEEPEADDH